MAAVKGVKNRGLLCGVMMFGVDLSISKDRYDANDKAVFEEFLLGEGHYPPTWRTVIYCLDRVDEVAVADKIRHFFEPVQGECTCHCSCESLVMH